MNSDQTIRMLHVEDDALDMEALLRLAREKQLPWSITTATTIAEARDHLRRERFDVVVADYHLPDGNCTELFEALPDVPLVLLTATLQQQLVFRTLERGADDYLPKDINQHYLEALPFVVDKSLYRQRLHKAEQQLTAQLCESEERLRLLVESVRDYAIFMLDPEGNITTWNRGAQKVKGYTASEIIGKHFSICYMPEEVEAGAPWDDLRRATERGTSTSERWFQRKDGTRFWAKVSINGVRDEHDELRGFVEVAQDLTARKEMEDELRELNRTLEDRVAKRTEEAEQKTAQLRRLHARLTSAEKRERKHLARVLHDGLQQLLVAAKVRLGVLKGARNELTLARTISEIDEVLEQSIESCRSLTAELVPPVLYDRGLVPSLHWLARQMEDKQGCRVDVEADETAEPTREDLRVMLFEATRELLFNAVKHTGGCRAMVKLGITEDGGQTFLTVQDDGPGFDPEAVSRDSGDSGYGLFDLRERAEALGGHLNISSAPGSPTSITVTVPLEVNGESVPDQVTDGAGSDSSPRTAATPGDVVRVLLADDHKAMRDGIASLLQSEQNIVVIGEAENGREAIELAHRLQPDVIVMDVTMPGMDGIEATRRIRHELPNVCVIGLSMHNDPSIAKAMDQAGATSYISKDAALDTMVEVVRECLQH